jgi:hypothetical protein
MHPVRVIRASRTAFALRPNRESTSTSAIKYLLYCHFPSFSSSHYPLLSSFHPQPLVRAKPSPPAHSTQLSFTRHFLKPSCPLGRVGLLLPRRPILSPSVVPDGFLRFCYRLAILPMHTSTPANPRALGLLSASQTQRNGRESTSRTPLPFLLSRLCPRNPHWPLLEHICN